MVKCTYNNFIRTMEILQNQAYMTAAEAERVTRRIFDSVEYDRQVRKVKSTYEVILTSQKTVKAVRLYVTLGGPTCWIDTEEHAVICHWGGDQAAYAIDWDMCDEIEEIIAEYMELDR